MRTARTSLITLLLVAPAAAATLSQEPVVSTRDVLTLSARVDRVDRFGRMLTLRGDDGLVQAVYVDPQIKLFDELKSGDTVRIRVVESVIVAVRPNAKPSSVVDTTAAARKAGGAPGTGVVQQLKAIVTIESVDPQTRTVVYKDGDNRSVIRIVADPRLLEGLKQGDVVELTYTRARAIELERPH